MFIGHFATGFISKKWMPHISLPVLFIAVQWPDLIWPAMLLLGWESVRIEPGNTVMTPLAFDHYPYSHSLMTNLLVASLFALWALRRYRDQRVAALLFITACSHWILDFVTHRPDLPLSPGSTQMFGLGWWNIPPVAVVAELALMAAGIFIYHRTTRATGKTGVWAFWGLIAFLMIIHTGNLLGPPPPNITGIALAGNLMWLFVLWAYWIEKNRTVIK